LTSGNVGIGLTSVPAGLLQVGTSPGQGLFFVKSDGNVGIGTTSPASALHVRQATDLGTSAADESILTRLHQSNGNLNYLDIIHRRHTAGSNWAGTNMRLRRKIDSTSQGFIDFGIDGKSSNDGLGFGSGTATYMVLTSTGNVGIGTTAPIGRLQVGTTPGAALLIVKDSGNVGIGTTDPQQALQVAGNIQATTGIFSTLTVGGSPVLTSSGTLTGLLQSTASGTSYITGGNVGIGNTAPVGLLQVGTSPTPGLTVLSSGYLGIATTAPIYPLDVNGYVILRSYTAIGPVAPSQTVAGLRVGYNTTVPALSVEQFGAGAAIGVVSGNVGIGTTAPYGLLQVGTNPSVAGLIVKASNNVGIGTTNPTSLLQVAGNILATTLTSTTLNVNNYNVAVSGASTISQDYSTTGTPRFARMGIGAAALSNYPVYIAGSYTDTSAGGINLAGTYTATTYSPYGINMTPTLIANANYASPAAVIKATGILQATTNVGWMLGINNNTQVGLSTGYTIAQVTGNLAKVTDYGNFAGTVTLAQAFNAGNGSAGIAGTYVGMDIDALTAGTTNIGLRSQTARAANRWNLYINGTADNYFNGNIGVGITAPTGLLQVGSSISAPVLFIPSATGNVGIGTTGPGTFKLEAAGHVGPNADNTYDLGSSGVKWRDVFCTRAAFNGSDARQKTNIIDTPLGLDFIMNLRPVQYNWVKQDDGKHQGLIAQELEGLIKDKGIEFAGLRHDKESDSYSLAYTDFIAPLIKAVQEQQKEIESLKTELKDLRTKLNAGESEPRS
ncbi:MAG: tail fiber domain-containing protein, partial [Candidatus Omnitrophica bacterium]|nr:tail fiber domain-containing protein [Candidatus Omnitrophota bacterium]MDD5592977.1 tail fiber domain-containing protein [Candidatus Omnitrophota bacterium]